LTKNTSLFYAVSMLLIKPFIVLAFWLKIKKKQNFPQNGKLIVCANHSSLMDPILLAVVQKRQIHYMAKAELFKSFYIGGVLKAFGAFPVSREKRDLKSMNRAKNILDEGRVLGIFFEGTRSKDGELLKPKAGAALLAHKTQTPILPVCINRTKGGPVRAFHKTKITIGTPIFPQTEKATKSDLIKMTNEVMEQISVLKLQQ
jgi:1-acyl-sn-glycerol-3-phosphate acyltransferase